MSEIVIKKNKYSTGAEVIIHETEHLSIRAKVALDFASRWGMVSCEDGGEDSTGRAKKNIMPVPAVVDRACDMSELLFVELSRRGWIDKIPNAEDLDDMFKED